MRSVKLQNVYLRATDMRASRAFYETLLGLAPAFSDGERWTQYRIDGANFALAGTGEHAEEAGGTVAVIEVDDLDQVGRTAIDLGGKVLGRRDLGAHGVVLTVEDPSGVVIQFFARQAPEPAGTR